MSEQVKAVDGNGGFLGTVERIGNKLPDPAVLFIALLFIVWILSWLLSYMTFDVIDPRSGTALVIKNLLSGAAFTEFLSVMVTNFSHFHPVGVVLVAMLGIGVAEHTGFINSALRAMLGVTARWLLTPMVILVGIVSHTAADAGYVLVIPLGGIIFHAAGRHPLAGIAAAFAGVSGGFSANFIASAIDPMLQGISQSAAQIIDRVDPIHLLVQSIGDRGGGGLPKESEYLDAGQARRVLGSLALGVVKIGGHGDHHAG